MDKLFTDIEYTNKSIEANEEGKYLYQYIHDVEYEITVPEYDENGNPIMIEIVDPETGETILVQKTHQETRTKQVCELLIDDEFKYVIFDGNYTYCVLNEDLDTLNELKNKKQEENILKAKEAVETGYVEYKDAQFETNAQTVGDLTATMLLMQTTGMLTYDWLSRDDKIVTLTLEDFSLLGGLIAEYKNYIWSVKYLGFKEQIENAETLEEVEAIVIDYNVPIEDTKIIDSSENEELIENNEDN